jgi:recombination protein RecA
MARAKAGSEITGGEGNLAARLVTRLNTDKDIGKVVKLGSGSLRSDIPYFISTQVPTVDYAIGRPGIPASRLTTIYGREGSGKSTLGYHILAETQKVGGLAILIDSEQRYTRARAASLGLNPDELMLIDGATLEQAFAAIEKILDDARNEDFNIPITVVYDSLAGSVTEKRLAADAGKVQVGGIAKFVNAELPRLKMKVSELGICLVIINQVRSRIQDFSDPRTRGYMERNKVMGSKQAMVAEWPLLFESSLMLYVNNVGTVGSDPEHPEGLRCRVKVTKSGISPHEGWRGEFQVGEDGINIEQAQFELCEMLGLIKHASGGWYNYSDSGVPGEWATKKIQRKDFGQLLTDRPSFAVMIKAASTLWLTGEHDEPSTSLQPDETDRPDEA